MIDRSLTSMRLCFMKVWTSKASHMLHITIRRRIWAALMIPGLYHGDE